MDRSISPSRWRLARSLHMGHFGSPSRRAMASHGGNFRNVCRRDECCSAGGRMDEGRSRERAQDSSCLLAAHRACSGIQPAPTLLFQPNCRSLDARQFAGIYSNGTSCRGCFRPMISIRSLSIRCGMYSPTVSILKLFPACPSSCSSPRLGCGPGRGRIFRNSEITADVLLASASLLLAKQPRMIALLRQVADLRTVRERAGHKSARIESRATCWPNWVPPRNSMPSGSL
jgi:hypothetical protein